MQRLITRTSLVRCICHCIVTSVAASCMALSNKKACNRAARAARSNEPFHTVHHHLLRTSKSSEQQSLAEFKVPGRILRTESGIVLVQYKLCEGVCQRRHSRFPGVNLRRLKVVLFRAQLKIGVFINVTVISEIPRFWSDSDLKMKN